MTDERLSKVERCMTEIKSDLKHIKLEVDKLADRFTKLEKKINSLEKLKYSLLGGISVLGTGGLFLWLVKDLLF